MSYTKKWRFRNLKIRNGAFGQYDRYNIQKLNISLITHFSSGSMDLILSTRRYFKSLITNPSSEL